MNWNPFKKSIGKRIAERRPKPSVKTRSINDLQSEELLTKWNARATPFVNFTDQRQYQLVGRAREICLNNSYGKGALRILKHNVIGEHGIRFQSHVTLANGKLNMPVNDAIEKAWTDFSQSSMLDSAGQANLREFQRIALSSMVTDGEFFVRLMYDDDYEYGVKIQEIDALRIPAQSTSRYRYASSENVVYKNGILLDKKTQKPIYYYMNEDRITNYDVDVNVGDAIMAAEILHGFIKERVGQVRGVPLGQTSAATLYMIAKYAEAALQNARVGASKVGFLEQDASVAEPTQYQTDEDGEFITDADGNMIPESAVDKTDIDLSPGTINLLGQGMKFAAWSPEYPNNEFESFMRVMLREASVGYAVPYADMTGDLTSVNYSSIRQGALDTRENYKVLQDVLIEKLLAPLFRAWLPKAIEMGKIVVNGRPLELENIAMYMKPVWTPKRWGWIDPQSEARSNQIAVKMGWIAPSKVVANMGGDFEETMETLKNDMDIMKAKGIPETMIAGFFAEKGITAEEILMEIGEIIGMGGNQQNAETE